MRGADAKLDAVRSVATEVATRAVESTLSGMGLLLLSYGSYGIFHAIVSSAFFYFFIGLMLVLTFSAAIRRECLRRMPPIAAKYLYRASLLDLVLDASAALRSVSHGVAALGVTSLLHREDISRLSLALPEEYAFLARPGLVHLMPPALQAMLEEDGQQAAARGGQEGHMEEGEEGEEQDDMFHSDDEEEEQEWYQPGPRQEPRQGLESGDENEDEGFFALPRVPRAPRPAAVARAPPAAASPTRTSVLALVGRSAGGAPAAPNFALFEATARQLGTEYAARWTEQLQSLAWQGLHYVASGGDLSTEQLVGAAAGFTAAGAACQVVVSRRHAGSHSGSVLLSRTLDLAAPVFFGVATTVSGMLAVRTCGGSITSLWRVGPLQTVLGGLRRRLQGMWQLRGLRGQALGVAVALSTLLLLVAFRMRARLRQVQWLAAVLLQRLQSGSTQAWRLLVEAE